MESTSNWFSVPPFAANHERDKLSRNVQGHSRDRSADSFHPVMAAGSSRRASRIN